MTKEELKEMNERVVGCDPCGIIEDLQELQAKTTSDRVYAILDTAIDVVLDHTELRSF